MIQHLNLDLLSPEARDLFQTISREGPVTRRASDPAVRELLQKCLVIEREGGGHGMVEVGFASQFERALLRLS